ncbi:CPBP family intramembrane glutamic endopeptidase [Sporosalibacterium faouarense]|uniref:CPBP family intramembrane glutamic endopeptidase n=1 Tax=Sporosalibacterium faouarense TaxID=516123 RepID=UPI00192C5075|nr:CPBP family intramembrane glutamic endopeptidase [Sporosalibacterium faouarense]
MKLNKGIFPEEIFKDIKKKDGYIAIIFIITYFLFSFIDFYLFKDFMLGINTKIYSKELRRLLSGIGFYILPIIAIFIILKLRNQKISTIGFRQHGLRCSIILGIILVAIISIGHILNGKELSSIIYNLIFFICILGFSEEIVFRGFLWPRLVVCFGKKYGTILSGIFFGIMHAPVNIVLKEGSFLNSIFNEIGGGIVGSLLFIYIYTRNSNIVLPSFIHGALDFIA